MKNVIKIIITSKTNLQQKYGADFSKIQKLFTKLKVADKKLFILTRVVYIDDKASAQGAGIQPVADITRRNCKAAVDSLFTKHQPAYMVLFGAQDVFPFQEISNPVKDRNNDDDATVPSDLPYACNEPYSTTFTAFTGPTRVVGRIPDIPGVSDLKYLTTVIDTIIQSKPAPQAGYMSYLAMTASVWKKSTRESISNIFGNSTKLKESPPSISPLTLAQVQPLVHFFNCHGSPLDSNYFGQKGTKYPSAINSSDIDNKIKKATVIAAECCYGAQVYNPANSEDQKLSIANTYLKNKALAFVGSSTIAYGPSDGQGLADLITQDFIKGILKGASAGRAFLEAQQQFLAQVGPDLDPYEQKTLAQFYLLGDPSVQIVVSPPANKSAESLDNRRIRLFSKGMDLKANMQPCTPMKNKAMHRSGKAKAEVQKLCREAGFTGREKEYQYKVPAKRASSRSFAKSLTGGKEVIYRTFVKKPRKVPANVISIEVLVIKSSGNEILGYKHYVTK